MCPPRPDDTRRVFAHWSMVTLFFFSGTASLGFALWTADRIVLRCVYGAEAVQKNQLQIVSLKPVPQVSNGDRLEEWGNRHFLITSAIWMPLCFGVLSVVMRLVPRNYQGMARAQSSEHKGPPGLDLVLLIPTVILVIYLLRSFVASGLMVLVALAMTWIINMTGPITSGLSKPPKDSVPDLD
jgi:hypothetical protein